MIYLTGDRAPSFREQRAARAPYAPEPFDGSTVFVADAGAARRLAAVGSAAVVGAIGGARAFVWMDGEKRVAARFRFDPSLVVSEDFVLDAGPLRLRIERGARVHDPSGDPVIVESDGAITLAVRGGKPARVQRVALREGRLEFAPPAPVLLDVSMRYFYGTGAALAGIRYPLIAGAAAGGRVTLDPLRPHTVRAGPAGSTFASTFTTPLGGTVTLDAAGGSLVQGWDPLAGEFYWMPDGPWRLGFGGPTGAGATAQVGQLLLGLQGQEYASILSGSALRFSQGPAYAPGFGATGASGAPAGFGLTSTLPGSPVPLTTAWVWFDDGGPSGPPGLGYYAQPQDGALFRPPGGATGPAGVPMALQALPLLVGGFPATGPSGATMALPAVPYAAASPAGGAGATAGWVGTLASFEQTVLAPARREILQTLYAGGPAGVTSQGPGASGASAVGGLTAPAAPWSPTGLTAGAWAVTQQGMVATFSSDYSAWNSVVLAQGSGAGSGLVLTGIGEVMRAALLANDVFLVISDASKFAQACSMAASRLTISGWSFDLAPRSWTADTILVIKLCSRDLVDAAADISYWTMPEAFNATPLSTVAARLGKILADPFTPGGFHTVLRDWNGILFLNCSVGTSGLPPQLAGLAAGVSTPTFTAHHLGIDLAPVTAGASGALEFCQPSLFAAIVYDSPGELEYAGRPYEFKVSRLQVAFENSQVVSFSSSLQLLVAELFGEKATLAGSQGGILLFDGTLQKHGDTDSYSFTFRGETRFGMSSAVLQGVTVSSAQFVTVQPGATVTSRFVLNGTLAFRALPVDVFSFGAGGGAGLAITNLQVGMEFPAAEPRQATFSFSAAQAGVSAPPGAARPASLYAGLPLTVSALLQGTPDALPETLGYAPVITPAALEAGELGPQWFGLELSLNLGSSGALAPPGGLVATLLLAWAPDPRGANVSVWIRLPAAGSAGTTIPLEGPLTLDVREVSLIAPEEGGYLVQFGTVSLGIFGLQLPFGSTIDLLLFGNPDPQGAASSVGWYGAFQQDET